jgi:hypothetical protein
LYEHNKAIDGVRTLVRDHARQKKFQALLSQMKKPDMTDLVPEHVPE